MGLIAFSPKTLERQGNLCPFFSFKLSLFVQNSYLRPPNFGIVMFAVVKIAGQQFRVQAGQSLYVPHLQGKSGDKVEFSDVLFTGNDGDISSGDGAKATVTAEIISDLVKGDKVIAFKMKRRKGFRKKHGHRTHYTRIKIESIA